MALGRLAPRYALWLRMGERGLDPDRLSRGDAVAFCRRELSVFLGEHDLELSARQLRRLDRVVGHFDPRVPTPYEHMTRLGEPARKP